MARHVQRWLPRRNTERKVPAVLDLVKTICTEAVGTDSPFDFAVTCWEQSGEAQGEELRVLSPQGAVFKLW